MTIRISGWQRVLLFACLAAWSACAAHRYRLETGLFQPLDRSELLKFPESYRLVQRVRLNVRGRSFDFIGYLAIQGDCLRGVALMEVGGEMFDLLACAGKTNVLKNPGRVPRAPLRRGIMRELACLFAAAPSASPAADGGGNERLAMKVKGPLPGFAERMADPGRVELRLFQNGRIFSEIEISSFRTIDGWPHPVPDTFTLKNKRWGYEMKVELLRMDMRPIAKQVFSER